ncbi:MAG: TlpA family protein disulfide reductase [bacterium]|nr:MAG: TlpA family protein disulfide reductase [bacterium]
MRQWVPVIILALTFSANAAVVCAEGIQAGRQAPPFDLSMVDGRDYPGSDELFSAYRHIFLIFWESGCPHCVESLLDCDAFNQEYAGGDIAVIGINSDEGDMLRVQGILDANGITFTQLWDRTTNITKLYEVPFATFAIYLIGNGGRVIASAFEPEGDIGEIMEDMLLGGDSGPVDAAEVEGGTGARDIESGPTAGFVFGGRQRIRFLGIDSQGDLAVGPYGEEVESKNTFLYRFEFEVSRILGRHLTVGGLLRLSNEGEEVLTSGPDYYSSEWGSAFAEISWNRFALRLGYFSIHMTPLTLMRWDWDDNPRTGGDAGCGCGAAAGALLIESLEVLGPDLTFEGGVASFTAKGIEARLFYAIPRHAREVDSLTVANTGVEGPDYSQEIYGFESRWQLYLPWTGSALKLGLHLVGTWEDERSLDLSKLGYEQRIGYDLPSWDRSHLLTITAEIPILPGYTFRGELVTSNRAESHIKPRFSDEYTTRRYRDEGGIAGVILEWSPWVELSCDYLRLDPEFYSPFAALSYAPNITGSRYSCRVRIQEGQLFSHRILPDDIAAVVSLFYKSLKEFETPSYMATERVSYLGITLDMDLPSGLGGSIGWLDRRNWRGGTYRRHDDYRRAFACEGRFRFSKNAYIQAQYQWIENSIDPGVKLESRTNLYSLYCISAF